MPQCTNSLVGPYNPAIEAAETSRFSVTEALSRQYGGGQSGLTPQPATTKKIS